MNLTKIQQDDPRVIEDAALKQRRVRHWLRQTGLSGVIISKRDQFAWLSSGGDSCVLNNSEVGVGHIVITAKHRYLVAHSMDAARLLEEQLPGQGYEMVSLRWFECDPRQKALELAGEQAAADTLLPGTTDAYQSLAGLHYPFTPLEIARTRWLASAVAEVLEKMASIVWPGQSEEEVAGQLHGELIQRGIVPDVLIVGSDERIFKYRHPLPTPKVIEKYILLHPAARKWGLHVNVTRSLYFGTPPLEVSRAYRAAAEVEAHILAHLKEGLPFAEILSLQKKWYAEAGFPLEWQNHFQGGPTGYLVVDTSRNRTETCVQVNQAFDWFVTVTGAKVEELSLLTEEGVEVSSQGSEWPLLSISTPLGPVSVPNLWVRPGA